MNKRSHLLSISLAALFLAAPNMVLAQPTPSEPRDPITVYVQAGASKEQQDKIRTMARDFENGAKIKIERATNLMKKMQQFSLEASPDEKAVLSTQEEINAIQGQLALERIKLMLSIRSVLTEEQRTRLVEILKDSKNPRSTSTK